MAVCVYSEIIRQLNSGIKQPLYFLHGDDQYLLKELEKKLLQLLADDGNDFYQNALTFLAKNAVYEEIEQALLQTSFFSDVNIVVVYNSTLFSGGGCKYKSEQNKNISALLADIPQNTHLLFINDRKADKRLSFYKLLEKFGTVVEVSKLKGNRDIADWLTKKIQETHSKWAVQAREYFIEAFSLQECSSGVLEQEWEKLQIYTAGKKNVRIEDLQAMDIGQAGALIFKISDAVLDKEIGKALAILEEYFLCAGSLQALLALLVKQCIQLMEMKNAKQRRVLREDSLNFIQKRQLLRSKRFSEEELKEACIFMAELDIKSKNGVLSQIQGRIALENYLMLLLSGH